ncbi:MAG: type I methionyl aminopeptidase [Deltaproteobacteria bacterium]|nr:type I methionyl aminopeptidase [Deltaproteobacteria bacterium]
MVVIKSPQEIEKIRKASRVVAKVLSKIKEYIRPGVSTLELDRYAEKWIREEDAIPAFKGYLGYKATLCTSVNEEVVHGIPSAKRILKEGDIVGVDCGAIIEGYYGDGAFTFPVGQVDDAAKKLMKVGEESLQKGIAQMRPDKRLYDIGAAIQQHAESHGYSIVREYVGHGIGTKLHEEPQVPNYGQPNTGFRLKPGMVFAIEPMINLGGQEVELLSDGWTVVTKDRKWSVHFEHTIAITENGPEILTVFSE